MARRTRKPKNRFRLGPWIQSCGGAHHSSLGGMNPLPRTSSKPMDAHASWTTTAPIVLQRMERTSFGDDLFRLETFRSRGRDRHFPEGDLQASRWDNSAEVLVDCVSSFSSARNAFCGGEAVVRPPEAWITAKADRSHGGEKETGRTPINSRSRLLLERRGRSSWKATRGDAKFAFSGRTK